MTTAEAAELWGITTRRVQILCDNGKVKDAFRIGRTWIIPKGVAKPIDGRTKAAKNYDQAYGGKVNESKEFHSTWLGHSIQLPYWWYLCENDRRRNWKFSLRLCWQLLIRFNNSKGR
jgi:hypothetical protein